MIILLKEKGNEESRKKGSNTWFELPIKYETKKGIATRTVRSFEDCYHEFKEANVGDFLNVTVKKDGQYWKWIAAQQEDPDSEEAKEITSGDVGGSSRAVAAPAAKTGRSSAGAADSGKQRKVGDWETAAERALKQRYIIAQSSRSDAISYFGLPGNSNLKATQDNVLKVATEFFNWAIEMATQEKREEAVGRVAKALSVEEDEQDESD